MEGNSVANRGVPMLFYISIVYAMNRRNVVRIKTMLCVSLAVLCFSFLMGCKASVGNVDMAVPYTPAQHYFVRNDVEGLPPTEITTRDEFDKYFGMAAVMGPGGMPTEIDFSKYFVVCLTMPPTDRAADLSVESLTRTKSGELELRYKLTQGEKRSYTIRPLILLMVDKKYQNPVRLEEI